MAQPAVQVATANEFGPGPAGIAARWIEEIDIAERETANWHKRGRIVVRRYKDEKTTQRGAVDPPRRYSILWSNVQTIGPALYARTPTSVVSRRFKDEDPVGREASEVLERATNYTLEEYDFDQVLIQCRQDYLLPGRGQVWVRYVPTFENASPQTTNDVTEGESVAQMQPPQTLAYEQVVCDHVAWDDFLTNPAREWAEVRWVARRVYMTRDELVRRFGKEIGAQVPLNWSPSKYRSEDDGKDELFKRAVVYEIWDKPSKSVAWVNKAFSQSPLDVRPDPLRLQEFFPCPKALTATVGPDSIIPVPDYALYQDQAEEVDDLTSRISTLTEALRLVGFYAGEHKEKLANVFGREKNNDLIPVESWAAFASNGGVKGLIEWIPIAQVVQALEACYEARDKALQAIYQVTGISDIIRGASDPRETAAAQSIKTQWGSLRIRDRQKEMARFARDAIRLKAEIIAEHFSIDTLKAMTGVKLLTASEKQALAIWQQGAQIAAQQAQIAQRQGVSPPSPPPMPQGLTPESLALMQKPTWEEVDGLLKHNSARQFRIEIETDSTIEPNETEEKVQAVEFVGALGKLIGEGLPAVQAAPPLGLLVAESVKFVARRFRVGREMEDTIDRVVDQIAKMPPPQQGQPAPQGDPTALPVAQIGLQTEQVKQQGENARAQLNAQLQQQEMPLKVGDQQLKAAALARDPTPQGVA